MIFPAPDPSYSKNSIKNNSNNFISSEIISFKSDKVDVPCLFIKPK